jgi:PucR C-terminal helix-turn-helix domain
MAEQPWHELPPEIASVLRPVLADVANEMIAAVRTVPAYARPIDGEFGVGIRAGVQEALRHFLAEIEAGRPLPRPDVYIDLGRGEMRSGRSLDSLLSAYRIGARVAWRRFAAVGVSAGLEPDILYLLAESLFAYIDVLSAESAEGHALEQSAAAGEAELRRRRLVRLLVREPPADAGAVEAAASEAGWSLPKLIAVIAIAGPERDAAASHLPADVIVERIGETLVAVMPDPEGPGRRATIERAIAAAGATAGLGTTVDWGSAAVSLARARAALALADGSATLIVAREQAGRLLLASDPGLARDLARDRLAPLGAVSAGQRGRLTETLTAWLSEQGRLSRVAARLAVHPQTVRYRLARLRELFGDALEDPDERFWLELALRAGEDQTVADGSGSGSGTGTASGTSGPIAPAASSSFQT